MELAESRRKFVRGVWRRTAEHSQSAGVRVDQRRTHFDPGGQPQLGRSSGGQVAGKAARHPHVGADLLVFQNSPQSDLLEKVPGPKSFSLSVHLVRPFAHQ